MQFSDFNFDRMDFFDASGTWTCPKDVDEIILVGSGGGAGGGGGGYPGSAGGSAGGAGSDTTMTGAGFPTQTFVGGAAGGAGYFAGAPGGMCGNNIIRAPGGAPGNLVNNPNPGGRWVCSPIVGNLNSFFFPGGDGGGVQVYADVSGVPKVVNSAGLCGMLTNYGAGWTPSTVSNSGGSGAGAGGGAFGIWRRMKVRPGAVYTLTIGSGGGGGAGAFGICAGGGGGAGGFLAMLYNKNADNAA